MTQSFRSFAILGCLAIALSAPARMLAQTPDAAQPQDATPTPNPTPQPSATDDPQQPPPPAPKPVAPPTIVPMGSLNIQNVSLSEVVNMLARHLKMNIIEDVPLAGIKNGVTLNTYGDPKELDARNLLDQILRINGLGLVQTGELYHIVQLKDISHQPLRPQIASPQNISDDDQPMLNLIFLKYVTVDALMNILAEFAGDGALIKAYPPANLLFVLDSRRDMRRLMELIGLFDNDSFANQRVRLFEVRNARPSDIMKELDSVLRGISLDNKTSTVKFVPIDRINTLIAVAPNAGVFDTVEEWLRKLDLPVKITAGAIDNYVYLVRYGRADCLAIALGQLFGSSVGSGSPYGSFPANGGYAPSGGGYGGSYGSPYGGGFGGGIGGGAYGSPYGGGGGYGSPYGGSGYSNPGGYGNANNFSSGFGGAGACSSYGGSSGGFGGSPYGGGYGGYTAQAPAGNPIGATGQTLANAPTPAGIAPGGAVPGAAQVFTGSESVRPPRIVANPLDNRLLIQADAQQYQNILRVLKDLDVPPRQILLEAKIYEVDLTDQFASGINYTLGPRTSTQAQIGLSSATGIGNLTIGALVANGRELLATLTLNENYNKVHMVSEPSLIATDSIPASINVGTQVPVSTGSTTIPAGTGVAVTQNISSENTGVTLQVNARVNPSGIVTLIINQEISGIAGGVSTGLTTPAFSQQIVQTQITVQDGDTIAIGGTISDSVTDSLNGIPGLVRIPWLGALFGTKSKIHTRTEMVIFMTPHVIYDETNLIEASDELKNRLKNLRRYLRDL
jgi:general secretion pathway protein D